MAFGERGPLAEALVDKGQVEEAVRELEAARYALSQYVSNTTLIETIGIAAFTAGAEAHQRRVELAELALAEAQAQKDAVASVIDGDLLRSWRAGDLTPFERRAIVAAMLDRVVLYPSRQNGKKTSSDIAERVQIVLKGNELLEPEHQGASLPASR